MVFSEIFLVVRYSVIETDDEQVYISAILFKAPVDPTKLVLVKVRFNLLLEKCFLV